MRETVQVQIKQLEEARDLELPTAATADSAGVDLRAALKEPLSLSPGERALVPTGVAIALPSGYEAQVRPRSGLAVKKGVGVVNAPGTIDADYRGEIRVILINLGEQPVQFERGDRIAQMVVKPLPRVEWQSVQELSETARGAGGFGHTGER